MKKRKGKRKREERRNDAQGPGDAEGREGRSKSRKTGSPGPQGSLLAGLFRDGVPRPRSFALNAAMLRRARVRRVQKSPSRLNISGSRCNTRPTTR